MFARSLYRARLHRSLMEPQARSELLVDEQLTVLMLRSRRRHFGREIVKTKRNDQVLSGADSPPETTGVVESALRKGRSLLRE